MPHTLSAGSSTSLSLPPGKSEATRHISINSTLIKDYLTQYLIVSLVAVQPARVHVNDVCTDVSEEGTIVRYDQDGRRPCLEKEGGRRKRHLSS